MHSDMATKYLPAAVQRVKRPRFACRASPAGPGRPTVGLSPVLGLLECLGRARVPFNQQVLEWFNSSALFPTENADILAVRAGS